MAEVSKSLTRHLEPEPRVDRGDGDWSYTILDSALADGRELLAAIKGNATAADGEKRSELVRLLASPSIIAISGQEGSFVAGWKLLLPIERTSGISSSPTLTFEEKEFGVALRLTPLVRQGGRIDLSVSPEVSVLSQSGVSVTHEATTARFPGLATRRTRAAVELKEGQSLLIAGWIERSSTDTIKRLPALGEVPILGALLRSEQFRSGDSELIVVVTPRIIRLPSPEHARSGASSVRPTNGELATEGTAESNVPRKDTSHPIRQVAAPAQGGFEVK